MRHHYFIRPVSGACNHLGGETYWRYLLGERPFRFVRL